MYTNCQSKSLRIEIGFHLTVRIRCVCRSSGNYRSEMTNKTKGPSVYAPVYASVYASVYVFV